MTDLSGLPTISESPSNERIRLTKRKLDDAFHILDTAVSPNDTTDRPPPLKRSNTLRSLYSTLTKYGIRTKEPHTASQVHKPPSRTRNTPHLDAILSRAASRTKSSFSFRLPSHSPSPTPFLPATAEYRPSSLPSFLSRLSTYKLSTYANKPVAINAVAASKCGWINDGKDRLVCGLCIASWVVGGREGLSRDAANSLVEKQRTSLVGAHKNGCPWKTRQCDDSIYCTPLQSPGAMIREIKGRSAAMDSVVKDILIKHPLSATHLNAFTSTVSSNTIPAVPSSIPTSDVNTVSSSETALLASLFGWSLVPPAAPPALRRASTTRASSVISSTPPSPPFSRASSVAPPQTGPAPLCSPISTAKQPHPFTFRLPTNLMDKPENALLQCTLCQRRIGLWSFTNRPITASTSSDSVVESPTLNGNKDTGSGPNPFVLTAPSRPRKSLPQRAFDLLKEHRSYCPYTVRSTIVPSFAVPAAMTPNTPKRSSSTSSFIFNGHKNSSTTSLSQPNGSGNVEGSLEGWRAVLTVVLRYGMAEKQRIEYNFLAPREDVSGLEGKGDDAQGMEVDNVKAMVHGVKTRGGKDLLKYVKRLLG